MAIFSIDSDKINNDLIPLAEKQISQLSTALSYANNLTFPYDDFNWGYVKNGLSECTDLSRKYSQWIKTVNSSYLNCSRRAVENLADLKICEVRKKGVVVK